MRGCLLTLVALIVAAVLVIVLVLPAVVSGLAANALQSAGFSGTGTQIDVSADPPFRLLTLSADHIRVRSTNVSIGALHADSLDVTLSDAAVLARSFGAIGGTLVGVQVSPPQGTAIRIASVSVSGSPTAANITLRLDQASMQSLTTTAVKQQLGAAPTSVTLAAQNLLTFTVRGGRITTKLAVGADGSLIARDPNSGTTFTLLTPGVGEPIRFTSVGVNGGVLVLTGTAALLH
jgi:hypothetical protein